MLRAHAAHRACASGGACAPNQRRLPAVPRRRTGALRGAARARSRRTGRRRRAGSTCGSAEMRPLFRRRAPTCCRPAPARTAVALVCVRRRLRKLVGEADANALLSGLSAGAAELASLGPLLGLRSWPAARSTGTTFAAAVRPPRPARVRGLASPRPAEDPAWIDAAARRRCASAGADATALLERQRQAQDGRMGAAPRSATRARRPRCAAGSTAAARRPATARPRARR